MLLLWMVAGIQIIPPPPSAPTRAYAAISFGLVDSGAIAFSLVDGASITVQ